MGIFTPPQLGQIQPTVLPSREGLIRASMEHQDRQAALQQESKSQAQSSLLSALQIQQQGKSYDLQAKQQDAALQQNALENQFRQQNQAMAILESNRAQQDQIYKIKEQVRQDNYRTEVEAATKSGDQDRISSVLAQYDPAKALEYNLLRKKMDTEGIKQSRAVLGSKKDAVELRGAYDKQVTASVDRIRTSKNPQETFNQEYPILSQLVPGLSKEYDPNTMEMLNLYSTATKNRIDNMGKSQSGETATKAAAAETMITTGLELLDRVNKLTNGQRLSNISPIRTLKADDMQIISAQHGLMTELITVMVTGAAATDPQYINFKKQLPDLNAFLGDNQNVREQKLKSMLLFAQHTFEDIQQGRRQLPPEAEKELVRIMSKYEFNSSTKESALGDYTKQSQPNDPYTIKLNDYQSRGVKKLQ